MSYDVIMRVSAMTEMFVVHKEPKTQLDRVTWMAYKPQPMEFFWGG